jgi:hypothetical protein
MSKHEKAGKPMQITKGPLKDKYFVVIDYLKNQFQGKDIKNIHKAHPELTIPCMKRNNLKEPCDSFVFGRLYPTMEHFVVLDEEIMAISKSEEKRLTVLKGGKDDTRTTSAGDNKSSEPGESESDGRSVPSDDEYTEVSSPFKNTPSEAGPEDGGDSGTPEEHQGPSKQKPKAPRGAKPKTTKAKRKR